jgi:hypothetical protein
MREIFRPAACALSAACLAFALSAISSGEVLAQAKQAPPRPLRRRLPKSPKSSRSR